ncbi:MAG: DUF542 domain-containing protein [Bacteroidales bacterium]|nr:DUF542 domain-containing protein [Bacteroidales bacterium]
MLSETIRKELTVGEIVTADFRAAAIFRNAGIDFCCGGKKSLEQVCLEKTLETSMLIEQLKNLEQLEERTYNFNEWSLDFLCDYIVNTHHKICD